jgi:predicted glycosyltransferase involved in capsule biosynthesis
MKTNLSDLTFLIPVRIDSIIRLENLLLTTQFLIDNFNTNVIVLEASEYNNGILKKLLKRKIHYIFIEDRDPVFYRTKYLNQMTVISTTKFIAIWDADVIIKKEQIIDSAEKLRNGYEVAFPFDGEFLDTSEILRELYATTRNLNVLTKHADLMWKIYGNDSSGGAILINRNSYIESGMENERFYGWGPEDGERSERWQILNLKIYRSNGPLFHLFHPRSQNSFFRSKNQQSKTNKELRVVKSMSKEELVESIQRLNINVQKI